MLRLSRPQHKSYKKKEAREEQSAQACGRLHGYGHRFHCCHSKRHLRPKETKFANRQYMEEAGTAIGPLKL